MTYGKYWQTLAPPPKHFQKISFSTNLWLPEIRQPKNANQTAQTVQQRLLVTFKEHKNIACALTSKKHSLRLTEYRWCGEYPKECYRESWQHIFFKLITARLRQSKSIVPTSLNMVFVPIDSFAKPTNHLYAMLPQPMLEVRSTCVLFCAF